MVDTVILKNQVTSYFLKKNITAINKVITDVEEKVEQGVWELGPRPGNFMFEQQAPCYSEAGRGWEVFPHAPLGWPIPGCDPTTCKPVLPAEEHSRRWSQVQEHSISWGLGAWRSRFPSRRCLRQGLDFCSRTISGLTKVLVRLAMTLHTWSRIVMRCTSSSRHLRSLQYLA